MIDFSVCLEVFLILEGLRDGLTYSRKCFKLLWCSFHYILWRICVDQTPKSEKFYPQVNKWIKKKSREFSNRRKIVIMEYLWRGNVLYISNITEYNLRVWEITYFAKTLLSRTSCKFSEILYLNSWWQEWSGWIVDQSEYELQFHIIT